MAKFKIKVGDKVRVMTGVAKNQEGSVARILKDKNRVIVEGVNMVSKHEKPSATNPQGGIKEMEAPLHISNVMLLDSEGNPTRVGYRTEDGKKTRFAKTNDKEI